MKDAVKPLRPLPEKEGFAFELTNLLFEHLSDADRKTIRWLFEAAFDHPWVDDQLRNSIAARVCYNNNVVLPEEFQEDE
jgi:hypothetical protein